MLRDIAILSAALGFTAVSANDSQSARKLQFAQWVFERHLHWIAAAEVKVGIIVAINTAMLGALAAAFYHRPLVGHAQAATGFSVIAAIIITASLICAYFSVHPRLSGPTQSIVYFGCIAKQTLNEYTGAVRDTSWEMLTKDLLAQIHRNAQIAEAKYDWVRASMIYSFISIPVWVFGIALLVRINPIT